MELLFVKTFPLTPFSGWRTLSSRTADPFKCTALELYKPINRASCRVVVRAAWAVCAVLMLATSATILVICVVKALCVTVYAATYVWNQAGAGNRFWWILVKKGKKINMPSSLKIVIIEQENLFVYLDNNESSGFCHIKICHGCIALHLTWTLVSYSANTSSTLILSFLWSMEPIAWCLKVDRWAVILVDAVSIRWQCSNS